MRVSGIDFPKSLLDALRDGRLVVFAGAGVSMGEPARLPDFKALAKAVALGTGQELLDGETEDRFLGRLHDQGKRVHEITAQTLIKDDPQPAPLHADLLHLYSGHQSVRLVTTNFDMIFEQAAEDVFDSKPDIFRAPALPLGRKFNGIVHVHGAVDRPDDMVLTDKDFGRAYLTEGWARRFVIDLFSSYTVLFVGYSHSEVVMNYLARALPPTGIQRFALTNDVGGDSWQALGIEPIVYPSSSHDDHQALYAGVKGLATYIRRGTLDWQRQITEIANGPPPFDEEALGVIDDSLSDPIRTRFFTDAASSPEWIGWLDQGGHLDSLFQSGELTESQRTLAWWLVRTFSSHNDHWLFILIWRHARRLNETFWSMLVVEASRVKEGPHDGTTFSRWVSLLLHTSPQTRPFDELTDDFYRLARGCIDRELSDSLVSIFRKLSASRLTSGGQLALFEPKPRGHHSVLSAIWETGLRPHLDAVAKPVLEVAVESLNKQNIEYRVWQDLGHNFDPVSSSRWAIEPCEYDRYPDSVDVLIDAARDCLEYLSAGPTGEIIEWRDRLSTYDAPILRRLAVHVMFQSDDLSADDKIEWLLGKSWIHDMSGNHEVQRVVESAYPNAGADQRSSFVNAVLAHRPTDSEGKEDEYLTARYSFDWLTVLQTAAPGCDFAHSAIKELLERCPDLGEVDPPRKLTIWDTLDAKSPLPVSDLSESLLYALQNDPGWPDDGRILSRIEEASTRNFEWGVELADALSESGNWETRIWERLLRSWARDLDTDAIGQIFSRVTNIELLQRRPKEIVEVLYAFVKTGDQSDALVFPLEEANRIARALWKFLASVEPGMMEEDWLHVAINHPAGTIAQFWCLSHSLWRRQHDPESIMFIAGYREALTEIIQDRTLAGQLGRSVLARNLTYLLGADEKWTKDHLLPLFGEHGDENDHRAVWHGFLYGGPLNPSVVNCLEKPFLNTVASLRTTFPNDRVRTIFVQYFTSVLAYFVDDPTVEWIPGFFKEANPEDRRLLSLSINSVLRNMTVEQQQVLWDRWLSRYWDNRIRGIPERLDSGEIDAMVRWLPKLSKVFPEAVEYATQMPQTLLEQNPIVSELAEGELWLKHPEPTVKLLAWLAESGSSTWFWHKGKELIDRLMGVTLDKSLRTQLEEIRARLGL